MAKIITILFLSSLVLTACHGYHHRHQEGKRHDTQIHEKCSFGSNHYKSSVNKHLECQEMEKAKKY